MNWSRSSSFESCMKADFSSSVIIQRTSSSSHFRYVLLNSILSALALAFRCFSGTGRFSGSVWLASEPFASLSCAKPPCAKPTTAKPSAITPASKPTEQQFRKPAENAENIEGPTSREDVSCSILCSLDTTRQAEVACQKKISCAGLSSKSLRIRVLRSSDQSSNRSSAEQRRGMAASHARRL